MRERIYIASFFQRKVKIPAQVQGTQWPEKRKRDYLSLGSYRTYE